MTVYFEKEKHLDILSARKTESEDIEVLSSSYDTVKSVYLVEYNFEWFVVIENPSFEEGSPKICDFEPHKVINQSDIYRLKASL